MTHYSKELKRIAKTVKRQIFRFEGKMKAKDPENRKVKVCWDFIRAEFICVRAYVQSSILRKWKKRKQMCVKRVLFYFSWAASG